MLQDPFAVCRLSRNTDWRFREFTFVAGAGPMPLAASRASARPDRESSRGAQRQTPGTLPVLWTSDELPLSAAVLSGGPSALAHVVEPAHERENTSLGPLR